MSTQVMRVHNYLVTILLGEQQQAPPSRYWAGPVSVAKAATDAVASTYLAGTNGWLTVVKYWITAPIATGAVTKI